MARPTRRTALAPRVTARLKVWLEADQQYVFGRGISDILQAVQRTGSIKAAAQEVGKSYRYVWDKLKQAEAALGAPLVHAHVGGKDARRSELSDLACDLLREFEAYRAELALLVQEKFARRLQAVLRTHDRD